jgi:rhamnulose-1-phosphate aldolase/alcohol dehydrogenase
MGQENLIEDRWSDRDAAGLSDVETLVYLSRQLGSDPQLVLWGGGNTSLKVREPDFRGRMTDVLRVKGSGSDLKAVTARDFPGVCLDDILSLLEREEMSDDEMVTYLAHAMMDPSSPRPSIETLLHGFVPARCVVHSHADAILVLTNNSRAQEILAEVFGDRMALIPYRRPGFLLSKKVHETVTSWPDLEGVILLNHGLITWHDDPATAYHRHIEAVNRAARYAVRHAGKGYPLGPTSRDVPEPARRREIAATLAPTLRGLLGQHQRMVLRFDDSADVLRFVSAAHTPDVVERGAATPDHILHTKRTPLWIESPDLMDARRTAQAARDAFATHIDRYTAYYQAHQTGEAMLPPVPRVVLVAGLGMFTAGKDSRAATIASDIYHHTIAILEAAEGIGEYRSLAPVDAFGVEYWPLELYKLTLAPPEKELSRRVALVTGAAGAIGSAVARVFAAAGAHVVCADIDLAGASTLAEQCSSAHPANRALAVEMDVTSDASVRRVYQEILLAYGGLDVLVSNAGIAYSGPLDQLPLEQWQRSLAVNATGHFLVTAAALRIMKAQGTGGSIVHIASKNVPAPGKDFGAYSAAKAAQAQLARVAALEGGGYGIRCNMINPDAVFAGSGLWTPSVREERARSYGIDPSQLEAFYRQRNILRVNVTAEDVALAALFYASDRSAKTTGSMLPVDGGLREAFPR